MCRVKAAHHVGINISDSISMKIHRRDPGDVIRREFSEKAVRSLHMGPMWSVQASERKRIDHSFSGTGHGSCAGRKLIHGCLDLSHVPPCAVETSCWSYDTV